jgi:hypothetical protein
LENVTGDGKLSDASRANCCGVFNDVPKLNRYGPSVTNAPPISST